MKFEKNATNIYKMLQKIYGKGKMARSQVFCGLCNFRTLEMT